ncbi:MAG: hypothetical protein JJE47_04315 [Acidimicrobiia bacterium]|nr:hypothetical protein [Acidimicrobiia bacterium]
MTDRNLLVDKVQAMFPVDEQVAVMDEARKDWRDVLAAAEYPRQSGYTGPAPPEVIAADRADYLEWLEGESPT